MKPTEVKFDGSNLVIGDPSPVYPAGLTLRLKRGNTFPNPETQSLRNQLLWYMPDDGPPELLFCNSDNQLFLLDFAPYTTP